MSWDIPVLMKHNLLCFLGPMTWVTGPDDALGFADFPFSSPRTLWFLKTKRRVENPKGEIWPSYERSQPCICHVIFAVQSSWSSKTQTKQYLLIYSLTFPFVGTKRYTKQHSEAHAWRVLFFAVLITLITVINYKARTLSNVGSH